MVPSSLMITSFIYRGDLETHTNTHVCLKAIASAVNKHYTHGGRHSA